MDERIKANLLMLDYRPLKGSTMNFIKNLIKEEDGVTAIEYALIASLIAGCLLYTSDAADDGTEV
jgi:hypothetical protein